MLNEGGIIRKSPPLSSSESSASGFRAHPVKVSLASMLHRQGQHLRHIIRMHLTQFALELSTTPGARFENRQHFRFAGNLALPAEYGLNGGDQIHTRCQLLFNQKCANLSRLREIREAAQHDLDICHLSRLSGNHQPTTSKETVNSGFIEKLIARLDRLSPRQVKNLVDRLGRERGFLENVFEALQEGVLILDPDGAVTFLNNAACGLFGLEAGAAVGQPLDTLVRGLNWSSLTGPGRHSVNRDLEVFYPENRFLNFYLSPLVEDVNGKEELLGYVMLVRDITESRRETEEAIESEKLNALTLLAAGVAHEIGNPLNSLGIHLQLLERKVNDLPPGDCEKLQEHLTTAHNEIQRLDSLLKEFLHAIRPASPLRKPGNLNLVLEDTLTLLAPELKEHNVSVHLDLADDMPSLLLDDNQLKQAFFNLLKNAYQALPGSGGEVHVESRFNEYEVVFSVRDNGSGISPEVMGSLFEPFRSGRKSGTGLGLLIVRRIVRDHGGEIEVESEEGQGTTVRLYFPVVEKRVRLIEDTTSKPKSVIEV